MFYNKFCSIVSCSVISMAIHYKLLGHHVVDAVSMGVYYKQLGHHVVGAVSIAAHLNSWGIMWSTQ